MNAYEWAGLMVLGLATAFAVVVLFGAAALLQAVLS